ncbi:hypothetical protein Tco_0238470 [Tanacetum coccineum]
MTSRPRTRNPSRPRLACCSQTSTIAPVISSAAHVVETTLVASPTGLCGLVPYTGSDSDSPDETTIADPKVLQPLLVEEQGNSTYISHMRFPIALVTCPSRDSS